jgi:hypothetical protein
VEKAKKPVTKKYNYITMKNLLITYMKINTKMFFYNYLEWLAGTFFYYKKKKLTTYKIKSRVKIFNSMNFIIIKFKYH